ncbi:MULTISPECIES: O-antigen ligase [unclassified Ruminococcus]|uniref:O-antigen ligase family protein n=1 Tax=unclassified Ruminococcus TaxID=2608920 RepID=UPI00210E18C5|nr:MULTISPECIES: O-antigen ligase family protein [unclassified Ruminococcus]MCQ4022669.1 hypothetical protein [Ruminococcus sp. zg-924]MCQ4114909.1 hypothetical protein [Ruminococcus sp. zg-921]
MLSKALKGIQKFFLNPSNFRITYLLTLFFANVCVIRIGAVFFQFVLMFWAALIIFFYYIKNGRILKIKYGKYLMMFLASITITALINISSNFWQNMLMTAHIAICFFVFYGMHTEKNKKRIYREIYILAVSVVSITFILNLAAFPLVCMNIHFKWMDYLFIIYENRFTGFFTNPNLLGFLTAVSIIFTHFLTKSSFIERSRGRKFPKWLLCTVSAFNLICLFLSDSNASFIFLVIYACAYIFFCVFKRRTEVNFKQFCIKVLKFAACSLSVCVVLYGARLATGFSVSQLASLTQVKLPNSITQPIPPGIIDEKNDEPVSFTHINKNVDSGRIRLLVEATTLFANYPIFGTGSANLVPYSQKYIKGGLHFSDLHNGYLTILVSSGIVGFIIFLGFAFHVARHMIKSLFIEKKNMRKTIFPCMFSFLFSYCIYSLFEKTLLFEQSFMVVIFWAILGYASVYMLKFDHLNDPIEIRVFNHREEVGTDKFDAPTEMENIDD